jgi:hypothetical protein
VKRLEVDSCFGESMRKRRKRTAKGRRVSNPSTTAKVWEKSGMAEDKNGDARPAF